MADNASGFVDYSTLLGLNADEERRLLDEAMARAQASQTAAQQALRRSEREAGGHYVGGDLQGETGDITTTASYTDYLKAKQDAAKQWAALQSRMKSDPFAGAVATKGQRDTMGGASGQLQSLEDATAGRVGATAAGVQRMRAEQAARADAERKAAQDRADADRKWKQDWYGNLYKRWSEAVTNGGPAEGSAYTADDVKQWGRMLDAGVDSGWDPGSEGAKKSIYRSAWGVPGGMYDSKTGRPLQDQKKVR